MKARVKGTNNIIDVEFDKDALNACYPPYYDKEHDMYYQPEQLEWVDNEENADPDYWTRLEHQYAGMAMQGILANSAFDDVSVVDIAITSIKMATSLIKRLKEERK